MPKARRGLTDAEKQALRAWFYGSHVRQSQKDAQQWFNEKYSRDLAQSTISDVLSSRYDHLDMITKPASGLLTQHRRQPHWKELEDGLFEWQQRMQKKGVLVTGDLLRYTATQLWEKLPMYEGQELPTLSNG